MNCYSLSCGTYNTIFSDCFGNIWVCGNNYNGQLGFKESSITIPKQLYSLTNIISVSCGFKHSLFLNHEGIIFSIGDNSYGQIGLGYNSNENIITSHKITNIPKIFYIDSGAYFNICITDDNKLYCFGKNDNGQLGLGDNIHKYKPNLNPYISNIDIIACGEEFVIAKDFNNKIYSWGNNEYGQLGCNNNYSLNIPSISEYFPDNIISIKLGNKHGLCLTLDNKVYGIGCNSYGQLGIISNTVIIPTIIDNLSNIITIECGYYHSICKDFENNLWVFGYNTHAQLGLGEYKNIKIPIKHPTLSNIIDISSGGYHTFIKTIDNKIYAFGNNTYSQLGIETSEDYQLKPIQVLQDYNDIWSTFNNNRKKSAYK